MEIRSLNIKADGASATGLNAVGAVVVRNSSIIGGVVGLRVGGSATLSNVTLEGPGYTAIQLAGSLKIDGAVIRGWQMGIVNGSQTGAMVDITNVVVSGTTNLAIDLAYATGTVAFSTIADSGTDSGTGPRAFRCGFGLTVRSSIIWTPGTTARVPLDGCDVVTTIAGPTAVPGGINADPQFIDSAYHISASSPAVDKVDAGPAMDFEGDPRPNGSGYDIGADER
jgi:hypothetical protein